MKLPLFGKNLRGFTLVELLIVIAIISILISIGLASFRRVQMQSRDRQRQADLSNMAGALEQFYGDNNQYPGALTELITNPSLAQPYLRALPVDPSTNTAYGAGNYLHTAQAYCLVVTLEIPPTTTEDCPVDSSTGHHYVVSSQD